MLLYEVRAVIKSAMGSTYVEKFQAKAKMAADVNEQVARYLERNVMCKGERIYKLDINLVGVVPA